MYLFPVLFYNAVAMSYLNLPVSWKKMSQKSWWGKTQLEDQNQGRCEIWLCINRSIQGYKTWVQIWIWSGEAKANWNIKFIRLFTLFLRKKAYNSGKKKTSLTPRSKRNPKQFHNSNDFKLSLLKVLLVHRLKIRSIWKSNLTTLKWSNIFFLQLRFLKLS